ncbi:MAG: HEPN domain-containing protein [Euryarchaeota archaeon]|nr:HEPN domain-containing protein [Euryarchaeota archaeon]
MAKAYYTLDYQFGLADQALAEARNLMRAKYYTSCISHCFQVAHRCAAGLLFGIESRVQTERDVGIGFESGFVSTGKSEPQWARAYRRLAALRHKADFEFEYVGSPEEAQEALGLAEGFHREAQRLRAAL